MAELDKSQQPEPNPLPAMARLLGLREDFLLGVFFEHNDWSFVVKCHALLESAVSSLLASHLNNPALEQVFKREHLSKRLSILAAYGVVNQSTEHMIRAFSSIRNDLVHDAKHTDFTFIEHLKDKGRRNEFGAKFSAMFIVDGKDAAKQREYVLENPKLAMWVCTMIVVAQSANKKIELLTELTGPMAALMNYKP